MRKLFNFFFLLLSISLFSQENSLSFKPEKGKSLIVFIRPAKAIGNPYDFPFGVDYKVFCILKNNEYGYTNIEPGNHWLNRSKYIDASYMLTIHQDDLKGGASKDFNSDQSKNEMLYGLNFEPDKVYYYKILVGFYSIGMYARFEQISEEEANELFSKNTIKLSKFNKPVLY